MWLYFLGIAKTSCSSFILPQEAFFFHCLLLLERFSRAGLLYSTLGALQADYPHEPGGGPEQEVDLSKKRKVVNTSMYPDEVIERLARWFYPAILECFNSEEGQLAFAAWQAEQARPTVKEKQDVPTGERPVLHSNCQRLFSDEAHPSGCAFIFVLSGNPLLSGPPGFPIRFRAGNCSMI